MKCNNLINILDNFNSHNAAAAVYYKPSNIVFIYEDNEKEKEIFQDIEKYLKEKLPQCDIKGSAIDNINKNMLESIIFKYEKDSTLVNVSGGNRLLGLLTYKICSDNDYDAVYIDMDDKIIYNLVNEEKTNIDSVELDVNDFIHSIGGIVINESSNLFNINGVQQFINYVNSNFKGWTDMKRLLKSNIVHHDELDTNLVDFNISNLNIKEKKLIKKFSDEMVFCGLANILNCSDNKMVMKFVNSDAKTFIFKTGTWLEVITYNVLKELREIDDIKGGVVFLWDDGIRAVKNEADVLAANNSELIYISCKDTSKYDAEDLNELQVYAEKIGGDNVKKILVTTYESFKSSIPIRAEEMGIHIIIFDGDILKFKESIKKVIE